MTENWQRSSSEFDVCPICIDSYVNPMSLTWYEIQIRS